VKQSRLSYNIHGQNIVDKDRLFSHLVTLNPAAVVCMDEPGLAREIKDHLPNATVIFRWNGDGGDGNIYQRMMPAPWLAMMMDKLQGDRRIMLYTNNESGLPRRLIAWLTELVQLANEIDVSLCMLNTATGNPQPDDWEMAKPVLELLAVNRQHVLGLHEYAGGVITSGLFGGYPDNAGVEPGKPGGLNLIPRGNWPDDVSKVTRYHVGRFKFLLDYCDKEKIKHPRIIITEHGFDDTSDIKPWLDKLRKTPPFQNIRGWKSLSHQWLVWWPEWSAQQAYFEQLRWANETIYKGSPVEAQLMFCYGNSGGWEGFQVDDANELQSLLVQDAQATPEPPVLYPTLPTPLDARWQQFALTGQDNYYIRPAPSTLDVDLTTKIRAGELFSYIPDVEYVNEGVTWIQVKNSAGNVGWASKEVLTVIPGLPPPVDPPPPPYTPDEEARKLVDIWRGLLIKKQHEVGKINAEITAIKWTIAKLETGMIEELDERPDAA
jgi:hypothetical protein